MIIRVTTSRGKLRLWEGKRLLCEMRADEALLLCLTLDRVAGGLIAKDLDESAKRFEGKGEV
jgi:hypothetical protein